MKKLLFLILLFFVPKIFGQGEVSNWYFGSRAGISFKDCNPVALTDSQIRNTAVNASISNTNGELLFYSDGLNVWNRNHVLIPGSDLLINNSGKAGDNNYIPNDDASDDIALFVSNPVDDTIYYLFVYLRNSPRESSRNNFFYYTIDLKEDRGLGAIVDGPINLTIDKPSILVPNLTAVRSNTKNNFWVITAASDGLYAFVVNKDGINLNKKKVVDIDLKDDVFRGIKLKVSPDGSKLILTGLINNDTSFLFDFDADKGIASNRIELFTQNLTQHGAEFSPSGNKLYLSCQPEDSRPLLGPPIIFQYDLTLNTESKINNSKQEVNGVIDGQLGDLQLGPDGKIYHAHSLTSNIGVINNPEETITNINYVNNALNLNGRISRKRLPIFVQSFFKPDLLTIRTGKEIKDALKICQGESETIGVNSILDLDSNADPTKPVTYQWFLNKILLPKQTFRTLTINTNENNLNSTYTLKVSYTNKCNEVRVLESSVRTIIPQKPKINNNVEYLQCDADSNSNDFITNFNLTKIESEIYSGSQNVKIDFFETSDILFTSPLTKDNYRNSNPTNNTDGFHKLTAKISLIDNLNCFQTADVLLKVAPSGLTQYEDYYTCELDLNKNLLNSTKSIGSSNSFFNSKNKTDIVIKNSFGALSKLTHNFSYYKTLTDATLEINEIKEDNKNNIFKNNDTIYIKISLKQSIFCESIGSFKIQVQELPIPKGSKDPITICTPLSNNTSQSDSVSLDASTGIGTDTYAWFLNDILIPNEINATLKVNKEGNYRVEASRLYTNNTFNSIVCIGYNTFTVKKSGEAIIESVTFLDNQDNATDNTITVRVSGTGNYEFSLNDDSLSSFEKGNDNFSHTFSNVPPGLNKVYVRDINNCGITSTKEISFLFFQRHFTPNGDNKFDTWKIQGLDNNFYTQIKVEIFDRFGRILKTINDKNKIEWDGIYNGKILPNNDYWYNIYFVDINGNVENKIGHFSLLR